MEHGTNPTYHNMLRIRALALGNFTIAHFFFLHQLDHHVARECERGFVVGALCLLHAALAFLRDEGIDRLENYRGRRRMFWRRQRRYVETATEQDESVDDIADLPGLDLIRGLPVLVLDSSRIAPAGFEQDFDDCGGLGEVQRRVVLTVCRARSAQGGGEGFDRGHHLGGEGFRFRVEWW